MEDGEGVVVQPMLEGEHQQAAVESSAPKDQANIMMVKSTEPPELEPAEPSQPVTEVDTKDALGVATLIESLKSRPYEFPQKIYGLSKTLAFTFGECLLDMSAQTLPSFLAP